MFYFIAFPHPSVEQLIPSHHPILASPNILREFFFNQIINLVGMLCFICNIMCKNFLTFNYILYLIATKSILSSFPSAGWLESHNFQHRFISSSWIKKHKQRESEREVERVSGKWVRHSHMSVYSQCSNIKPLLSVVPPQTPAICQAFLQRWKWVADSKDSQSLLHFFHCWVYPQKTWHSWEKMKE